MEFEIDKKYNFFDDGKICTSRHYIAEVTDIIPFNKFHMRTYINEIIQELKYVDENIYKNTMKHINFLLWY